MDLKIIDNPSGEFHKEIFDFQLKVMDWDEDEIFGERDRYFDTPESYVVAYEDNKIIGSISLFQRNITFDENVIHLGGIGGVCVDADFRRRGVAKSMLILAVEKLKNWQCEVGYLCADIEILGKLYESVGFVSVKNKRKSVGKSGKIYIANDVMLAQLCSEEKFNLILNSNSDLDLQGSDW